MRYRIFLSPSIKGVESFLFRYHLPASSVVHPSIFEAVDRFMYLAGDGHFLSKHGYVHTDIHNTQGEPYQQRWRWKEKEDQGLDVDRKMEETFLLAEL